MTDKSKSLFTDFPDISTQEWEELIVKDLKGADYDKKLVWKTLEGINVKPYYRAEHISNIEFTKSFPTDFPYVRGNKKCDNEWKICEDIYVVDYNQANQKALNALDKGASGINFILTDKNVTKENLSTLLNNICLIETNIDFSGAISIQNLCKDLQHFDFLSGAINLDSLGILTIKGNFCKDEKAAFDDVEYSIKNSGKLKAFAVNAVNFHNAGASATQELAFGLSMAVEYLNKLTDKGLSVDDISSKMKFVVGIGSNYFMEIAKVRAARLLWAKIIEAYNPKNSISNQLYIHAITSEWNKTSYDPYVNMLRTTTESMSAVIGGVEILTVTPFDITFQESDTFSERIARNTQIILKEESNMNKIIDPSAGSYYIENLTQAIANEALKLFVEIEDKGGYLQAFKDGFIQLSIKEMAQKRDMNIAMRSEIILGTNQYPNPLEKISNTVTKTKKPNVPESLIAEPIRIYRGAEAFEKIRLQTERAAKTPRVFMFTFGNLAMRKARAMFSSNFFGCAGYEIIDNLGFKTIEEGIKAAKESQAEIIVICSSDEEYPEIVPQIAEVLHTKILVVAGYPKEHIENFKKTGVTNFIHLKSNLLETLQDFNQIIGIT
ncbi:MAG TPA: methylmalonyl-CoA mutase small subunit [Bacteroidales bacterium]|nr:MAG: methylmalonyl-CoA mutase small subunit [Bacteroidetes bacterium GWF2_33_38]OFY76241.1 MAG: methylmalonyl-CoA mutase small subunit [Bacteroidetes bacterium RIFOXYA12_FULL_33_9]OFY84998.1 MAG: methylmalonyl-CoA mutase small subunit [Bacteroidetes bacterium RIFOXYA2_FULL_33_7]HBF87413.1 methylmalonyl-CoA mutase small subunit [Bacteroidales bacterium]